MKEKQLHGEELTKEDLKRAVKDEAYRKKLLEEAEFTRLIAFSQKSFNGDEEYAKKSAKSMDNS